MREASSFHLVYKGGYAEFRMWIMVIGADAFDGGYASQLNNTGIKREWVSVLALRGCHALAGVPYNK